MSSKRRPTRNVPKADSYLFLSSLSCVRSYATTTLESAAAAAVRCSRAALRLAQLPEVLRDARAVRGGCRSRVVGSVVLRQRRASVARSLRAVWPAVMQRRAASDG